MKNITTHKTHSACKWRIGRPDYQATCCTCYPHPDCDLAPKGAEGQTAADVLREFDGRHGKGSFLHDSIGQENYDELKSFILSAMKQAAEAVISDMREPTLCGKCNLNGKLCKECYANRRANAARQEQINRRDKFFGV